MHLGTALLERRAHPHRAGVLALRADQTGSLGGTRAATISAERQAAYVIRTYLLNAARGIKRVHWYSYNIATGKTVARTLANLRDAAAFHLAGLREDGYPTPEAVTLCDHVDLDLLSAPAPRPRANRRRS